MANKTIGELTAGTSPLDGSEIFHGVQSGNSRKFTADELRGMADGVTAALAQGDLLYVNGDGEIVRLAKGTAGQVLRQNEGATAPEWWNPNQVYRVQEEQASGVSSGSSVGTSYAGVVLNTEDEAGVVGASLSSNQVILPAGTYEVMAWVPFQLNSSTARSFRVRLYNVTDSTVLLESQTMRVQYGLTVVTHLRGKITVAASKSLSLQARAGVSGGVIGGGDDQGSVEIYSILEFRRVS